MDPSTRFFSALRDGTQKNKLQSVMPHKSGHFCLRAELCSSKPPGTKLFPQKDGSFILQGKHGWLLISIIAPVIHICTYDKMWSKIPQVFFDSLFTPQPFEHERKSAISPPCCLSCHHLLNPAVPPSASRKQEHPDFLSITQNDFIPPTIGN